MKSLLDVNKLAARSKKAALTAIAIFILGCTVTGVNDALATNPGWTTDDSPATLIANEQYDEQVYSPTYWRCPSAMRQSVVVSGELTPQSACITQGKDMRMGTFVYPNGYVQAIVSFGHDQKMYRLNDFSVNNWRPILLPGTNTVLLQPPQGWAGARQFLLYKDFPGQLVKEANSTPLNTSYILNLGDPTFTTKTLDDETHYTKGVAVSQNGQWIVARVEGYMVRINAQILSMELFSRSRYNDSATIDLAISDDGRYGMTTAGSYYNMHAIQDGCGKPVNTTNILSSYSTDPCPVKTGRELPLASGANMNGNAKDISFSSDAGKISLIYGSGGYDTNTGNPATMHRVTITSPGYAPPPQLDYLALGDSYSSGEGDVSVNPVTNSKYYRADTDISENQSLGKPREKCHISTRSYPYLLAKDMNLTLKVNLSQVSDIWQNVTCSGATAWDIKDQGKEEYLGQGDRLKNYAAGTLKGQALNEFIPGRQKQIEFVRKYKPKTITLTMGGNDIGFSDKMRDCASPLPAGTCSWAKSDGKRSNLASEIRSQFKNLSDLYDELYRASGNQAKIYVVGYPQFINDSVAATCPANIGFIDASEREMITQSITYLNNVIKKATKKTGVKYIDISNSLQGNRLCDSDFSYVNGITDVLGVISAFGTQVEEQESFHPNSAGHAAIWLTIKNATNNGNLNASFCPDNSASNCPQSNITLADVNVPTYFSSVDTSKNSKRTQITNGVIEKSSQVGINFDKYAFKPQSQVNIKLFSDPIDLGSPTVASDGTLNSQATLPANTPTGYHTLVVSGETYSGEAIEYEQTVLVVGTDTSDKDENGIPDSQQLCGPFIVSANQDADFDGIDDACDAQISEPVLYMARNGDASKGEDQSKVYVYRNTRASSLTGIIGDYTQPNSYEALVASSQTSQTTGAFNKFVMLNNGMSNEEIVVLVKDINNQCIALGVTDHLSPALNPASQSYASRGFVKLNELPQGENCE